VSHSRANHRRSFPSLGVGRLSFEFFERPPFCFGDEEEDEDRAGKTDGSIREEAARAAQ